MILMVKQKSISQLLRKKIACQVRINDHIINVWPVDAVYLLAKSILPH